MQIGKNRSLFVGKATITGLSSDRQTVFGRVPAGTRAELWRGVTNLGAAAVDDFGNATFVLTVPLGPKETASFKFKWDMAGESSEFSVSEALGPVGPDAASFVIGSRGTFVSFIGLEGRKATEVVSPNDGRVVINSDGTGLEPGPSVSSPGVNSFTIRFSDGSLSTVAITTTAAAQLLPLSGAFIAGSAPTTLIANFTGFLEGEYFVDVLPKDDKVVLADNGKRLIVGMNPSVVGTISYRLTTNYGRTHDFASIAGASQNFSLSQLPAGAVVANWDLTDVSTLDVASGKAVTWRDKIGGKTFTNVDVPSRQPTFNATGWDGTKPCITVTGTATASQFLKSTDFVGTDEMWVFLVMRRSTADQNALAGINKNVFATFQPSTGRSSGIQMQRTNSDPAQTAFLMSSWGGGQTVSASGGLGKGVKAVVKADMGMELRVNSSTGVRATTLGASGTVNTSIIGSETTGAAASFDIVEILVIDRDKLKCDGTDNHGWIIEGMLAHKWGTQSLLPALHPHVTTPPRATDWTGYGRYVSMWGNSLTNGFEPHITASGPLSVGTGGQFRSVPWLQGGVGGETSTQIYNRFKARVLTNPEFLEGLVVLGEWYANGAGTGATQTVREALCEAADTVLAAGGQPIILGKHVFNLNGYGFGGSNKIDVDAEDAYLAARYPNNFLRITEFVRMLAAPGALYADPVAFAAGKPPPAVFIDTTHYIPAVYQLVGNYIGQFIKDKGYLGFTNAAPVVLNALTLSPTKATVGVDYVGALSGRTPGSTLSLTGVGAQGLTIAQNTGAVTGKPIQTGAIGVIETLAGAVGSPRTSDNLVAVAAAGTLTIPGPFANPKIAVLGSSRDRQGALGTQGSALSMPTGQMSWMQDLDPRVLFPFWYDLVDPNSFSMNGYVFAADGQSFGAMDSRLWKLAASDADIVMMTLTSNSMQDDTTLVGYTDEAKALATAILAAGKLPCVTSLVERITTAGGPWAAGRATRRMVPQINATMKAWCESIGIPFVDIRSIVMDLSDPSNLDPEPKAWATYDGTHYSAQGGYAIAKLILAALAPFMVNGATTRFDRGVTGSNLVSNPAFSTALGTGTVSGAGASGVAPDGWAINRSSGATALATMQSSVVNRNGRQQLRLAIDVSGMAVGDREGFVVTPIALPTVVAGKWYQGVVELDVGAYNGWISPGKLSAGFGQSMPAMSGSSPIYTLDRNVMTYPTETHVVSRRAPVYKAPASGTNTFAINAWFQKQADSQTTAEIFISLPELMEVPDPIIRMYNENDTAELLVTSSPTFSFDEEGLPTFQITTNKPYFKVALSGADVVGGGLWIDNGQKKGKIKRGLMPDFEQPNDANADRIDNITATVSSFNPNIAPVIVNLTGTTNDIADGITDTFVGPDNQSLELRTFTVSGQPIQPWSILPTTVLPVGQTGAIYTLGNVAKNDYNKNNTAFGLDVGAPSKDLYIIVKLATTSAQPDYIVRAVDGDNLISLGIAASSLQGKKIVNGVGGTLTVTESVFGTTGGSSLATHTAWGNGSTLKAMAIGDSLYCYSGDVYLGKFDIAGVAVDGRKPGIRSSKANSNSNTLRGFQGRPSPAVPNAFLVYLKGLTPTTASAAVSAGLLAVGANRTPGDTTSVNSVTLTGTGDVTSQFFADGDVLRWDASQVAPGTYTVSMRQTHPMAANTGGYRDTTITLTLTA